MSKQNETIKKKNRAKVIAKVISNPLSTQRELAKETWLSKTSIHNHLKTLDQDWPKLAIIEDIINKDARIVDVAQQILLDRMEKTPDKVSTRDIISAGDISARRYSIFKWEATNKEWWLKEIKNITINVIWNGSTI